jgi:hypothetical protein
LAGLGAGALADSAAASLATGGLAAGGSGDWLDQVSDAWSDAYGGPLPGGQAAHALKPPVEAHGIEEVCRRLKNFAASVEARYASVARFAQTFGAWKEAKTKGDPFGSEFMPSDRPIKATVS